MKTSKKHCQLEKANSSVTERIGILYMECKYTANDFTREKHFTQFTVNIYGKIITIKEYWKTAKRYCQLEKTNSSVTERIGILYMECKYIADDFIREKHFPQFTVKIYGNKYFENALKISWKGILSRKWLIPERIQLICV